MIGARNEDGTIKAHEPTDKMRSEVKLLSSFGHTHTEIATYFDIDEKTLTKYYRRELDTATIEANAQVAKRLFHKAVVQDDLTAQMFWLKTRARWRERDQEDTTPAQCLDEVRELRKDLLNKNEREY